MLLVTGDTHGDFKRFSKKNYGQYLTENDIVIICGDFGLLWTDDKEFQYWKTIFENRPWQTLFVAGNHENYDMLEKYPIEEFAGGKCRKIAGDKVIHLERGQIFELEGKKIFTFGGASSHDIEGGVLDRNDPLFKEKIRRNKRNLLRYRINKESWWQQELPTETEMQEGLQNLEKHNNKVDIIISHCCSNIIQANFGVTGHDVLTDYFDIIEEKINFKQWYFGHYHEDRVIDEKHCILYKDIKEIRI